MRTLQRRRRYLFISLLLSNTPWREVAASAAPDGGSDAWPPSGRHAEGLRRRPAPRHRSSPRVGSLLDAPAQLLQSLRRSRHVDGLRQLQPTRDELPLSESEQPPELERIHPRQDESRLARAFSRLFHPLVSRMNQRRHTLDFRIDSESMSYLVRSGLTVAVLCWLCSMVWGVVVETVDNFNAQINNEDPILFSREDVESVVGFLHLKPTELQQEIERYKETFPMHLLQLVKKLALAGLPLTASPESSQSASIQSVLTHITKRQASLLQQCLWNAPTSSSEPSSPWARVVGLEDVKERMASTLSLMIHSRDQRHQQAFASLFDDSPTSGILLYGPPGCGKTLLVKAMATATRIPCLVVAPSALLRQYVGETNAQVKSLFELTQLLAPCILCIDELDGIFRERRDDEHQVNRDLKIEFLQWMDGLLATVQSNSKANKRIVVIGATNRPFDVDAAVLRRLPQAHYVGLPDRPARAKLLKQLLSKVPNTCLEDADEVTHFVLQTQGYTPSDLKQLLRTAALMGPLGDAHPRPLTLEDLTRALRKTPPTPLSQKYRQSLAMFCAQRNEPLQEPLPGTDPFAPTTDQFSFNANWESESSKFYDLGSVQVDQEAFEALSGLVDMLESMSDDDGGHHSDREVSDLDEDDEDT